MMCSTKDSFTVKGMDDEVQKHSLTDTFIVYRAVTDGLVNIMGMVCTEINQAVHNALISPRSVIR